MFIPCFGHVEQMDFYDFADGACRHTLNLSLASWVLYSPSYDLVSSGVVFIGPATNNIEYRNLVVLMDSQLVVCHLNHFYTIRNNFLLCLFWRVRLLERSFKSITYRHIPREDNVVANSLANYILDWHISHS